MIFLNLFFIIILLSYCSLIIYFLFTWDDIPWFKANCKNYHTTVSIVVAFKNEETNIPSLLDDLFSQEYPAILYEIILVDNNSSDHSIEKINQRISSGKPEHLNIKVLESNAGYKKEAIATAIKSAVGELIVSTDADCRMNIQWLKTIIYFYQQFNFDAASAPVEYVEKNKSYWEKFQQLEFLSLIGTGAASIAANMPIMCNGANLIFKRSAFYDVDGYTGIDNVVSGDDTLLFQKFAKAKKRLSFIKAQDAIVRTNSSSSISDFVNQRKRWASKVTGAFNIYSSLVALIVYLFNLILLITGILSFFNISFFNQFIFMFSIKIMVDFLFFSSVLKFFKRKNLLFIFLPAEILYVFYVVAIGTLAPFGNYKWKDKVHK